MKKWMLIILITGIILGLSLSLTLTPSGTFASSAIKVEIDGALYYFNPPPIIRDNRTLVPMRALFEALGAVVDWEPATQTAVGSRGGVVVRIPIGSTAPTVNSKEKSIDVPAQIIEGRTYIPLRFVGESLGDTVVWDSQARCIAVIRAEKAGEKKLRAPVVKYVAEDTGTRVNGRIPFALKLSDGRVRLYYADEGGIYSAVSADGLSFSTEGVRLAAGNGMERLVADPTVIRTADGSYRMYYKGAEGGGPPSEAKHRTFSAISRDGLNFTREGLIFDRTVITSVPDAIVLPDGRIRLYFVYFNQEERQFNNCIRSAVSTDGVNFKMEPGTRLGPGFVDPAVILLPDETYLMLSKYYSEFDRGATGPGRSGIYVFHSVDGLNFSEPVFVSDQGIDPCLLHLSENKYRVYYWVLQDMPTAIKSFVVQFDF